MVNLIIPVPAVSGPEEELKTAIFKAQGLFNRIPPIAKFCGIVKLVYRIKNTSGGDINAAVDHLRRNCRVAVTGGSSE